MLDASTGTNTFDAYVFNPQWLGDFTGPGYLLDLTDRVDERPQLDWQDIGPFFRDFNATLQRQGLHDPARRRLPHGLLPQATSSKRTASSRRRPGTTTSTVAAEVQRPGPQRRRRAGLRLVHRQEEGRRRATGGSSRSPAACSRARAPSEGAFFDTTNMNPLFGQNEAMTKALETYKKTADFGPPDEINLDVGDTRGLFTTGRCALSMDWGDIGTLAPPGTYVQDKTGADDHARLEAGPRPGHRQARRRATRRPARTPSMASTTPRSPRSVAGPARSTRRPPKDNKDAAYDFLVVHERTRAVERGRDARQDRLQPVPDVALRATSSPWIDAGLSEAAAEQLPRRHQGQPREPEHGPRHADPARPSEYEQDVLDTAVSQYLAGELDAAGDRCRQIADGWNADHRRGGPGQAARGLHRQPWRPAIDHSTSSPRSPVPPGSALGRAPRAERSTRSARGVRTAPARWLFIWPTVLVILVPVDLPARRVAGPVALEARRSTRAASSSSSSASRTTSCCCSALERTPLPRRPQDARPRSAGRSSSRRSR